MLLYMLCIYQPNNSEEDADINPFYRSEIQGSEKSSYLPKATKLVNGRGRIRSQALASEAEYCLTEL